MNKIGLYLYNECYIDLYFDTEILMFQASYSEKESPKFDRAKDALNYCKKLIDLDIDYYDDEVAVYKPFGITGVTKATALERLQKEMWSVDYHFAKWALPRVLYFKNFYSDFSIPGDFIVMDNFYNPFNIEYDEWEQVLTDIVTALRLIIDDVSTVETNVSNKIDRGLKLFSKYIRCMWT